jgi:hypothetical protein
MEDDAWWSNLSQLSCDSSSTDSGVYTPSPERAFDDELCTGATTSPPSPLNDSPYRHYAASATTCLSIVNIVFCPATFSEHVREPMPSSLPAPLDNINHQLRIVTLAAIPTICVHAGDLAAIIISRSNVGRHMRDMVDLTHKISTPVGRLGKNGEITRPTFSHLLTEEGVRVLMQQEAFKRKQMYPLWKAWCTEVLLPTMEWMRS